ncbi:hypothetical protein [Nonomuraea sp. NPDC049400]|uniref:hypothetical protein n=1 Tax=Nonomuraea sp. NPDC049400 TaxID=3364352 RepID=UPI00379290F6
MRRPHPLIAQLACERTKAGLSVSAMARRLFVDRRTFRQRETGLHEPSSLAQLDAWGAVFGLRLAFVPIEEEQSADQLGEAS